MKIIFVVGSVSIFVTGYALEYSPRSYEFAQHSLSFAPLILGTFLDKAPPAQRSTIVANAIIFYALCGLSRAVGNKVGDVFLKKGGAVIGRLSFPLWVHILRANRLNKGWLDTAAFFTLNTVVAQMNCWVMHKMRDCVSLLT